MVKSASRGQSTPPHPTCPLPLCSQASASPRVGGGRKGSQKPCARRRPSEAAGELEEEGRVETGQQVLPAWSPGVPHDANAARGCREFNTELPSLLRSFLCLAPQGPSSRNRASGHVGVVTGFLLGVQEIRTSRCFLPGFPERTLRATEGRPQAGTQVETLGGDPRGDLGRRPWAETRVETRGRDPGRDPGRVPRAQAEADEALPFATACKTSCSKETEYWIAGDRQVDVRAWVQTRSLGKGGAPLSHTSHCRNALTLRKHEPHF